MADLDTVHATIDHDGLPGVGGASLIRQVVRAQSTAADVTTAVTAQNSSLSLAITPTASDSILEIEVNGACEFLRVAGSPTARYGWVGIRNSTNSVDVCFSPRGVSLIGTSSAGATAFHDIALRGFYTVNSTAARTFVLQFYSGEVTNTEARIKGDRSGGVWMQITEWAP